MKFAKAAFITVAMVAAYSAMCAEKDRARVAEFADKGVSLNMTDSVSGKITPVKFKSAKAKEIVFIDNDGGELVVPTNSKSFRFSYARTDELRRAYNAVERGEVELAIEVMRSSVYPLIPMTVFEYVQFPALNEILSLFTDSLIQTGRIKEAAALAKVIPIASANPSAIRTAIKIGVEMAKKGDRKDAIELFDRIPFDGDYAELYPDAVEFLGEIRNAKIDDGVQLRYIKLGNTDANPLKNECALWSVYCEIVMGKKTSAKLSLGEMKTSDEYKKGTKIFSLYKLVDGMFALLEKRPADALDKFAEGIVYGSSSDAWVCELLFNAGITYKKTGNITAANEIFLQICTLYPEDSAAERAKSEIVKPKEKSDSAK